MYKHRSLQMTVSLSTAPHNYLVMKYIVPGSKNKKMIVKLTYFGAEFETEYATFRPACTGLDHAFMVACGLTQILAEGSGRIWGSIWVKPQTTNALSRLVEPGRNGAYSVSNSAPNDLLVL